MACCNNRLVLVYQGKDQKLYTLTYDSKSDSTSWSSSPEPIVSAEVKAFDLVAYNDDRSLMLAYRGADDQIYSLTYQEQQWATSPTPVGFRTGGDLVLAVLGASLYLIYHAQESQQMKMLSYNTAPFNMLKIPYKGKIYDYMTINTWSPTEFPVTHFSDMSYAGTPKEREAKSNPYSGGTPLTAATLEGVLHLAHPNVSDSTVMSETFSLHGIMTPKRRVSYDPKDPKTLNTGFGTLMQAGWSTQEPIPNVYHRGPMTMVRYGAKLMLFYQTGNDQEVRICQGQYVSKG